MEPERMTLVLKEYLPPDCTCCFRGPGCKVAYERDPGECVAKEASDK